MPPYHIILADDHSLVRQGLRRILEEYEHYKVVAEVGSGRELFQAVHSHAVDLVIMDITLPDYSGLEAARKIKEAFPDLKIVIVSLHESQEIAEQAMAAGADGFVVKEKAAENLCESIKMVL